MLSLVKYIVLTVLAAFSVSASAIPSSTLSGNGVAWTLNIDSMSANVASFTLSADVSGSTSILDDAYLHEFSLKNFGSNASISNLTASAGTWGWQNEGLSGNGCGSHGTFDALCVYNTGNLMDAPSTASDFMFSFDVSLDVGDLFPELVHFKVRWVESPGSHGHGGSYAKVGGLISDNFNFTYVPVTDEIPEPGIPGLMVIGLLSMFALRKFKA